MRAGSPPPSLPWYGRHSTKPEPARVEPITPAEASRRYYARNRELVLERRREQYAAKKDAA